MITGDLIKKMRKEANLTQQDLADGIDISQAHIAKIETGKVNPRLSTVNKILSFLEERESPSVKCKKIMKKRVISVKHDDTIPRAIHLMKKHDISQLPVMEDNVCLGVLTERTIIRNLNKNLKEIKASEIIEQPLPIIGPEDNIEMVRNMLEFHSAVLVYDKGKLVGIITKSDLLGL